MTVSLMKLIYNDVSLTKTIGSDEADENGWIYVPGMKAYNFGTVLNITAEGTVPAETEGETVTVIVSLGKQESSAPESSAPESSAPESSDPESSAPSDGGSSENQASE